MILPTACSIFIVQLSSWKLGIYYEILMMAAILEYTMAAMLNYRQWYHRICGCLQHGFRQKHWVYMCSSSGDRCNNVDFGANLPFSLYLWLFRKSLWLPQICFNLVPNSFKLKVMYHSVNICCDIIHSMLNIYFTALFMHIAHMFWEIDDGGHLGIHDGGHVTPSGMVPLHALVLVTWV